MGNDIDRSPMATVCLAVLAHHHVGQTARRTDDSHHDHLSHHLRMLVEEIGEGRGGRVGLSEDDLRYGMPIGGGGGDCLFLLISLLLLSSFHSHLFSLFLGCLDDIVTGDLFKSSIRIASHALHLLRLIFLLLFCLSLLRGGCLADDQRARLFHDLKKSTNLFFFFFFLFLLTFLLLLFLMLHFFLFDIVFLLFLLFF
ncbi:hypothetical protein PENTCL1PPCAC_559, partial [Pristionchus entomophagus]